MFKNYFPAGHYMKTTMRNLWKNKAFSVINIMGLALGLACSLLIMLWVNDEYKVDAFHKNGKRLYSVFERQIRDGQVNAFHGTPGFEKMWELLSVGNQLWVKNASVLMMCTANKLFEKNGEFNRHYMHDTGMANANLLTQATAMGIYCHILGGFDRVRTDDTFEIPETKEVVCFIALGYLGNGEQLEEPFKTREVTPRTRKSLDDIAHQL